MNLYAGFVSFLFLNNFIKIIHGQDLANITSCKEFLEDYSGVQYDDRTSRIISLFQNTNQLYSCNWRIYAHINSSCPISMSEQPEAAYPDSLKNCDYDSILHFDKNYFYINHCGDSSSSSYIHPIVKRDYFILNFRKGLPYFGNEKHGHMYVYNLIDHAKTNSCRIHNVNYCVENLNCENGKCACDRMNPGPNFGNWKQMNNFGGECQQDSDCNVFMGHSCLKDKKNCGCDTENSKEFDAIHHYSLSIYASITTKWGKANLGNQDIPLKMCGGIHGKKCINRFCYPPSSTTCENDICVCKKGYKRHNNSEHCLGDWRTPCQTNEDCIQGLICENSSIFLKRCDCPNNKFFDNVFSNKCLIKLNEPCSSNSSMNECFTNTYCKEINNGNYSCQCKKGFAEYEDSRICYPGEGEKCVQDRIKCHHESLECRDDGLCGCADSNKDYEGNIYKKCVKKAGASCMRNVDCVSNMICLKNSKNSYFGNCTCSDGFINSDDKFYCIHKSNLKLEASASKFTGGSISAIIMIPILLIAIIGIGINFAIKYRRRMPFILTKSRNNPLLEVDDDN